MRKVYNTLLVALILVVVALLSVSCSAKSADMLMANSSALVGESKSVRAVEKIIIKDLNVAGIMTVLNVDINVERVITPEKTTISLNTANMDIKVNQDVSGIIDGILDLLGLTGRLTVTNLESAFSRINLDLKAEITDSSVGGKLIINNVKHMFKPTQREAVEVEFNNNNAVTDDWYMGLRRLTSSHLIGEFSPLDEKEIKPNKKYRFAYDNTSLTTILDGVLELFGTEKVGETNLSVKDVLVNSFGTGSFKDIFDQYVRLDNMTGSGRLDRLHSKDYVRSMEIRADLRLTADSAVMDKLIDNLAQITGNSKINEFYKLLSMVASYDNVLTGKIDMSFEYDIE